MQQRSLEIRRLFTLRFSPRCHRTRASFRENSRKNDPSSKVSNDPPIDTHIHTYVRVCSCIRMVSKYQRLHAYTSGCIQTRVPKSVAQFKHLAPQTSRFKHSMESILLREGGRRQCISLVRNNRISWFFFASTASVASRGIKNA